jgi:hypothetical protein
MIQWDRPGPLSGIDDDVAWALAELPDDPVELCRAAQGLVMLPHLAAGFGIPDSRSDERSIRPASAILRRLLELDRVPVGGQRPAERRVVGTCRHFALLACAFLRHRGFEARARCGFAAYFVAGKFVDHWVTEYRDRGGAWVRLDPEILGFDHVPDPANLQPGAFLTGGEAWRFLATSDADPMCFGVDGVAHAWGTAEVRGNAIRDLAALNRVETLPWDEWGRMAASYQDETGPEFDALISRIADVCASDDVDAIEALYATEDLAVPPELIT